MQALRSCSVVLLLHLALACGGNDDATLPADARAVDATVTDAALIDVPLIDANLAAPALPLTSFPDYTTFIDNGINIYWRAAIDETTAAASLEYRMTYRQVGGPGIVGMDWKVPALISVEASGRMWTRVVPAAPGVHELWISVRDADLNMTDYPALEAAFGPCRWW